MGNIKLVILESPYAGDILANVAYARRCLKDCTLRGESALASHLLLTQVLDDTNVDERALGLAWRSVAHYSVFYTDRGWPNGMIAALRSALAERRPLKLRALDGAVQFPDPFDISNDLFGAVDLSKAAAYA